MIPVEILIENFKSHKRTHINCREFNSALITGSYKNDIKKSNGVGKTTLFDAIEYVLFGIADVDHLDDIVLDDNDKCTVSFTFEMPQGSYKIVRTRNKKTSKSEVFLYEGDKDISQKTDKETNIEIAKLIGISHVAFRNSTYFAQRDMFGLASATPKERKAILKEPLQITVYSKYEKAAKEKASAISKNIDNVKILISALGDPKKHIDLLEQVNENHKKDLIALELEKKSCEESLLSQTAELQKLLDLKNGLNSTIELQEKCKQVTADIEKLSSKINTINFNIEKSQTNINDYNSKIKSKTSDISKIEKDILDNEKKLVELSVIEKESIVDLEQKLDLVKKNEANGINTISKTQLEIDVLSKPMKYDENCINCKQEISKEYHSSYEESRKSQLDIAKANLAKYKPALDKVIAKRKGLEAEIRDITLKLQQVASINNGLIVKKEQLNNVKTQISDFNESVNKLNSSLSDLNLEKIELEKSKVNLVNDKSSILETINSSNSSELDQKISAIQKEIVSIKELINKNTLSERNGSISIGANEALIAKHKEDLVKIYDNKIILDKLEDELNVAQKVVQAFSSGGIPTFIINTVLDDLQIEANKILSEIRPELEIIFAISKNRADGQQEDTLDISYRVNGRERKYRQLSGGQKWFVALGLKMGLSIIIQKRLGVDIKILEFDEIDEPMDAVGKESFWNLIKKWQEDFKIFIITHDEYLKSKFSNVIMIENDPNYGSCGRLISENSN